MKFTLTLKKEHIKTAYADFLQEAAKKAEIKGFRKGKAPLNVVETHLDKAKLYEQVLNRLLPSRYQEYLKSHDLHPIAPPKISILKAQEDQDWTLEVEIAQKPEVKLGDYETAIRSLKTPTKTKEDQEDQRLNQIFDLLLKTCLVEVPALLIDEETNHRLSNLIYQIDKLGLNLESYTSSLNKTPDQLKQEYREAAEASLKLEFILDAISEAKKLQATSTEISEFISKIEDSKVKEAILNDESKRQNLSVALTKRKVTDYLLSLTTSPIILSKSGT